MAELKIGAFVMTFERPKVLRETLLNLLNQTLPPQYILVVDNSLSNSTKLEIENLKSPIIDYYQVGYNSGPAGAAKIGLEKLTAMGFDWIYWGDDDNPPRDENVFLRVYQNLGKLIQSDEKIGLFSGKGGEFNRITGRIKSFSNKELFKQSILEVDTVPGGHDLFVNSKVVKANLLPNEKLFFGFEELDFSLQVKSAGFKILIDAELWLNQRLKVGNDPHNYRWKGKSFGNIQNLQREYYTSRNLLHIFFTRKLWLPFIWQLIKILLKIPISFKYGMKYGAGMSKVQIDAISDFLRGKLGERSQSY